VSPYRRSARPLSAAFDALSDALAPATVLADVQRAWPAVVGAVIAAEATPSAERAGVLTVSCSASVWAQELDLMSPMIVQRLNAAIAPARIERLRCVATPPRY
jgi:predicted nucleic acid-binding Zn ribbon protein